jgi:hypothetical protein
LNTHSEISATEPKHHQRQGEKVIVASFSRVIKSHCEISEPNAEVLLASQHDRIGQTCSDAQVPDVT